MPANVFSSSLLGGEVGISSKALQEGMLWVNPAPCRASPAAWQLPAQSWASLGLMALPPAGLC